MIGYDIFNDILNDIVNKYITIGRNKESIKKGFKTKYYNGNYKDYTLDEIKQDITTYCFETAVEQYVDRLNRIKE